MNKYLLDTNIVSALMKAPGAELANRVRQAPAGSLVTSMVVAGELRFGAIRKNSARLMQQVEEALDSLDVLPVDDPVGLAYAQVRNRLERAGTPIGTNDLWIAAHALALDCVLVTANDREFRRVPDLAVENWMT